MKNEQFSQYVEDFIKTQLEDEANNGQNSKYKTKAIIFAVLGAISVFIFIINMAAIMFSEDDSLMSEAMFVFVASVAASITFISLSLKYFKKSKNTTALNVNIVLSNLDNFVSKYIELNYPYINVKEIKLTSFGGGAFIFQISNIEFHCEANIEEIVRRVPTKDGYESVYYFINSISVIANFSPIKIENTVRLKLGETKTKNIDNFVSESIKFNKTYEVNGSKSDGFNLLTPVRIESLINNKHLMKEIEFYIKNDHARFSRSWEVQKTYNRDKTIASKPLTEMSADDNVMLTEIIKHVQEIVENPIKNWKIVEALLLEK